MLNQANGIQIDGFSDRTEPPGSIFEDFHDLVVFACVFWLSGTSSERSNDRLRMPKACSECFSDFIHPGYSKSGLKGFRVASLGSIFVVLEHFVVPIQNLSVVLTVQGTGNRNKIDTAICSTMWECATNNGLGFNGK